MYDTGSQRCVNTERPLVPLPLGLHITGATFLLFCSISFQVVHSCLAGRLDAIVALAVLIVQQADRPDPTKFSTTGFCSSIRKFLAEGSYSFSFDIVLLCEIECRWTTNGREETQHGENTMHTGQAHGLVKKQGLTQAELAEIKHLADLCNRHEGLNIKLNQGILEKREQNQANDFLYYEDGTLIGFLPLFSFNSAEAEISGMVHPDYRRRGVFTALTAEARAECQRRGFARILLIVESLSPAGMAFAQSLGASYDHSEYAMVLEEHRVLTHLEERLHFRPAAPEDLPLVTHITARVFDVSESEVHLYSAEQLQQADYGLYVGVLDGEVIGKIDVSLSEYEGFLYGFGVSPEYQGHGYGRQILACTVQEILARGKTRIALEVSVTNRHALSLYHSCGFQETGSYEYYHLLL